MTFPDTTFVSQVTKITQVWSQAVNDFIVGRLKRTLYPEDYNADPTGVTAWAASDVAAFMADWKQYHEAVFDGNYKITSALQLSNMSNRGMVGKGRIFLSGAASGAFVVQLIGTCDDLLFQGFSLAGDANAAYSQTGLGNYSGQTLSRIRTIGLNVSGLNVGISMAGNGGSCDKWFSSGCVIDSMSGTAPGQGYGFHVDNATNGICLGVQINDCSRHSIYQARGSKNTFIAPIITNHRLTEHDNFYLRCALVISRSSDIQVLGGEIIDAWDGQLEVSHDSSTALNCTNIVVDGLKLVNRKNTIYGVNVGGLEVPVGYMARNIRLKLDIVDDYSLAPNPPVIIYNGSGVSLRGSRIRRTGINGTARFISLGHPAYISTAADCTDIILQDMEFIAEGTSLVDVRVIDVDTTICGNTSTHTIGPNVYKGAAYEVYPNAVLTNPNVIVEYTELKGSAVYNPPNLVDGTGATTTVTVTGCALGDCVSRLSFSNDVQGFTVTGWVSAANTVSVRFQNESGGALDLASGTLRVWVKRT